MKNKYKKMIIILLIIILIIFISIYAVNIFKTVKSQKEIDNLEEIFSNTNVQKILEDSENNEKNDILDLAQEVEGKKAIGIIKIDKIKFEGLVYEGIDLDTLRIGVGHFPSSPYLDGNVCLAAHNTNKFWANLKNLKIGDKIKYSSFFGSKEYEVFRSVQIEETDFSLLENTEDNIITLITCVKNNKPKRLCVQAKEIL